MAITPRPGMPLRMAPSRSPQTPVAQALAEAALQRQNILLEGSRERAAPAAAPGALPGAPPADAAPEPRDQVSLSPQARQSLAETMLNTPGSPPRAALPSAGQTSPSARNDNRAAPGAPLAPPLAPPVPPGALATPASGSPGLAPAGPSWPQWPAWPAAGLPAPLRSMVGALVQQLTASVLPQQVARAQPWPAELVRALEGGATAGHGSDGAPALPPLQTWLVRQGVVQTPEGARGVSLTLRVPAAWLQTQSPALAAVASAAGGSAAPVAAAQLQAAFSGPPQDLQSGAVALVLQDTGPAAARTSALLLMDFQPPQAAQVYGREMLHMPAAMRLDPWVHMAALQASGQVPREEDKARGSSQGLCQWRAVRFGADLRKIWH